jgi:hypothetical protein
MTGMMNAVSHQGTVFPLVSALSLLLLLWRTNRRSKVGDTMRPKAGVRRLFDKATFLRVINDTVSLTGYAEGFIRRIVRYVVTSFQERPRDRRLP